MTFIYNYKTWEAIKPIVDPKSLEINSLPKKQEILTNKIYSHIKDEYCFTNLGFNPIGKYFTKSVDSSDLILYKLNKHFFRSQHFKNLNQEDINILYTGCSWTFGSGLPENLMWTNFLTNKIQSENINKKVESFNVALPGAPIFSVIKNAMSFIRNYGKPTYIFMIVPPVSRDLLYDPEFNEYFQTVVHRNYFEEEGTRRFFLDYVINHRHENSILKAVETIKMFEDFCNAADIKLIWTNWHYPESRIYEEIDFNNYMKSDQNFRQLKQGWSKDDTPYYDNPKKMDYWEVAQDDNHPGSCWSLHISDKFFESFLKI